MNEKFCGLNLQNSYEQLEYILDTIMNSYGTWPVLF